MDSDVQVATAVQADWLFLLTDVDALYTSNPVSDPEARPIHVVHDISQLQVQSLSALELFGLETSIDKRQRDLHLHLDSLAFSDPEWKVSSHAQYLHVREKNGYKLLCDACR